MKTQTVIWTALPGGISDGRLLLSVVVSPRLRTDEGLPRPEMHQFPDFLRWPETGLTFAVHFDSGPTVPATVVSATPRSDLWSALVKSTTFVRPFAFRRLDDRLIRSFPAMNVADFIKNRYQQASSAYPDRPPNFKDLNGWFRTIAGLGQRGNQYGEWSHGNPGSAGGFEPGEVDKSTGAMALPPGPANPALDFTQVRLFHQPRGAERVAVAIPDLDFHQLLAMLGDYPELMRQLGLIFDLAVPMPSIPAEGRVQVIPTWEPELAGTTNLTPWTAYTAGVDGRFTAASRPTDPQIKDGLLPLDDKNGYGLIQIDVDGSAEKAMQFADHMFRSVGVHGDSSSFFLPALRSAGLTLIRTGRAYELARKLADQPAVNDDLEAGKPVTFYAEDLVRGYRMDIWDDASGRWHSLCRRSGAYRFTATGDELEIGDEGFITMGIGSAADGSSPDLFLHEAVCRWEGWSLVAPRPGRIIDPKDAVAEPSNAAMTEFGLETAFKPVAGTLPRLRYGRQYRVRARVADLAGNSLRVDEPDPKAPFGATAPEPYGRFDPIVSPTLILREPVTPGESLERLVIRSNYDTASAKGCERHVAPPKVAQLIAEQHGMFDTSSGLDKAAYAEIISRDSNFAETEPGEELELPYLPDPIARGAAFAGLPGSPVKQIPFSGPDWPDLKPFRIRIAEGTGAPTWNGTTRVLTVNLPKATIAAVKLSAHPSPADLQKLGIWHWLQGMGLSDAKIEKLKKFAIAGGLWPISPPREIVLVHAVQQPLIVPAFQNLQAVRDTGNTFATLVDSVTVDAKSTGRLDIAARWEEPVDLLNEPGPRPLQGAANPCHLEVPYTAPAASLAHRHEFGDTKYRKVLYSATATTRFQEYFEGSSGPFTRETAAPTEVEVLSSARPAAPKVLYVVPTFGWDQESFDDGVVIKRSGGGLRVYLERPWYSSGDGELLGVTLWPGGVLMAEQARLLQHRITVVGMDPIRDSAPTRLLMKPEHFPLRVATGDDLSIEEAPGVPVDVAGHGVKYDTSRRLWYCDIAVDAGPSYYPFVRLALARYQPKSIPAAGVELSRVVLADFAQVAPNRLVTVTNDPSEPKRLAVNLCGPGYRRPAGSKAVGEVEVSVETRRPDVEGELGWIPVVNGTFPMSLTDEILPNLGWTGQVMLPEPRGSKPFRLVVKEYEKFVGDSGSSGNGNFGAVYSELMSVNYSKRRLVFAAVLEV